jgi:hypothetical protein
MTLFHWTPRKNLAAILKRGLLPHYAVGNKRTVWACRRTKAAWALLHVAMRHGFDPDQFVLIEVKVTHSKIRKTCWRGVYTCDGGYPPERIVSVRRHMLSNCQEIKP